MAENRPKAIILGGPTATGKSSIAIELAKYLDGEIVNADSMQVYCLMDIGTAKPTSQQRAMVPHHMYDVVYPDEPFNAAIYRNMALARIKEITSRGKVPIIVGGTGLYIKTLRGGLFACPPADAELRRKLVKEYEEKGPHAMHKRLEQMDSETAARVHPNDMIRVTRALEIYLLTGKRPSELAEEHGFRDRPFEDILFCLCLEREVLYERINRRSIKMVEEGLVEETEALLEKGYSPELKPLQAIGYRHMIMYLEGQWNLDYAIAQMQKDTRRYAKRQMTWFRGEREFIWVKATEIKRILAAAEKFLHAGSKPTPNVIRGPA